MIPCVIPYYKDKEKLRRCIGCLKKQTMPVEIHVEDDSELGTGYTAAVNRGLRHWLNKAIEWEYIIILNQDMYLEPKSVESFYNFMQSNHRCGAAVAIQRIAERPHMGFGGGADCYPQGIAHDVEIKRYVEDYPVFWGDNAAQIIRKATIWDIGILDENFVLICSDSDYSLRARSRGWEVWIVVNAIGTHEKGLSMDSSPEVEKQKDNDRRVFYHKWVSPNYYEKMKYEIGKPIYQQCDGFWLKAEYKSERTERVYG